ncbi:IDEAL domain-containing protein [Phocicoccus pinnipedialis]|uniref:IDEAL domain protein n=1 Tax=Phocicoccus pinnipedialis TaxID=110845 RepID=A0A6V7RNG6_9BACL|nr:IDEAL domain-containing protein [Jeotgalicoccus pinnipedialis]MBP1939586.1 uncharacterized protein YpiB (UPF0302 family) [Jeotgalicoccus pinnipedialis]CAD2079101.1 IDEAL domain protein [Jeotgalicoccus pinnipedialis]
MEKRTINILSQKRAFLDAINDLSSDMVLQDSIKAYYRELYNEKIETALIVKDKETFIKYTDLLNEL